MTTFRHILICTDFSEASQPALETGRDLARALGARLTLLHVYSPGVQALGVAGVNESMEIGREVHEALVRLKDKLAGVTDLKVETLADPSPAGVILDYAVAQAVDLIVLGSHGHGAARRFLLGSVADRITNHATCSVLVARPSTEA